MLLDPNTHVLVTGGAGFIGSNLVYGLNERGIENIVIADFLGSDEKWRNLVPLKFVDYLEADDLIARVQSGRLANFDVVLHMGACSSTTEKDARYLAQNNYDYTRQLAEWTVEGGGRFVYASSAATYGDGSAGMSDSAEMENLGALRPLNMYGYSKHLFDVYAARTGLLERCAGLKYFNIFGPGEQHKREMRSIVNKAFSQVRDTGVIRLFRSYRDEYRDGEQRRDFLYVKDAAAMTLHIAGDVNASGLFNIGAGRADTWLDIAHAVFAAMGREPHIEFIDMPVEMRSNYQYTTLADISKLQASGYDKPAMPLSEAVRDYIQEYLAKGEASPTPST
ncbi:MAG: ADP-glyceromanno-heptose 6-epimerase [Gemmatimonadaceae bacterium]